MDASTIKLIMMNYLNPSGEKAKKHLEAVERTLQSSNFNHLGLFSEDVSEDGSQWGNFPQTYSHVGLINTAFRISRLLNKPDYFM